MARLAAICTRCGYAFTPTGPAIVTLGGASTAIAGLTFEGGGVEVEDAADVAIQDVGAGNCPRCKVGRTRYFDGVFKARADLLEVVHGSDTTVETLRDLGLLFAEAAQSGATAAEVAEKIKTVLPTMAEWLVSVTLSKEAMRTIFAGIAGAIALEFTSGFLHRNEPKTVINNFVNNFPTVVIQRIDKEGKHSEAERARVLTETVRRLQQAQRDAKNPDKDRDPGPPGDSPGPKQ